MSLAKVFRPAVTRRLALAGVGAALMAAPVLGPTAASAHTTAHAQAASVDCHTPSMSALHSAM